MIRKMKPYYIPLFIISAVAISNLCSCHSRDISSVSTEETSYIVQEAMENTETDSSIDGELSLAGQISSLSSNKDGMPYSSSSSSDTGTDTSNNTSSTIAVTVNSMEDTAAYNSDIEKTSASPSTEETASTEENASTEETAPTVQHDGYITGNDVKVRSTPDFESDNILTSLYKGDVIGCVSETDGWTMIIYNGQPAYIYSKYVSDEPLLKESEPPYYEHEYDSGTKIGLSSSWLYAEYSVINSGYATYYRAGENRKNITVCVNAGHGTSGVDGRKTLCHPDGTPKVTGGTTSEGATKAIAVSYGMEFDDGTPESKVTLAMAKILKVKLLDAGYDVLMIRETDDVQLDNVARTVIANNCSDCHIALHWDSTSKDKGAFYMSVPSVRSYRNMEPVASHWKEHERLGESLISGLKDEGVKIFSGGSMEMDLTQTSYSTVPSIDIELGDSASSHSESTLNQLGDGLLKGIDIFFRQ